MHRESATTPATIWGLWTFFTFATLGFVVFVAGVGAGWYAATMAGAGLMAFSTLLYLFVHFAATAHASYAQRQPTTPARARAVADQPKTPRAQPVKAAAHQVPVFSGLVQRSPPSPTTIGRNDGTQSTAVARSTRENVQVLHAGSGATASAFVPAVRRRGEITRGLPLVRGIFEDPAPKPPAPTNTTRGTCGGCNASLVAPAIRPVRLRCPRCGRSAWID